MINTLHFASAFDHELLSRIKAETQTIGYYNLPLQTTDYIDNYLKHLDECQPLNTITDVVVVGIGGSILGAKAVYQFIKSVRKLTRKLRFIDSTDPVSIQKLCVDLDWQTTHFLIVSKSGCTIETLAIYQYLLKMAQQAKLNFHPFTFITDKNSPLVAHAEASRSIVVNTQDNIGGRFSLLSAVGLIPLVLAGVKIKDLLAGAAHLKNRFFEGDLQKTLLKKATFYAKNSTHYRINTLFSYSDSLQYFNQWYAQLWGESLGKKQKQSGRSVGLTPIALIGPQAQHSFLQLLMEGPEDKTITFIKIKQFENTANMHDISLRNLTHLDLLNNIQFSTLINLQADAIIESLNNTEKAPLDEIILEKQDEFSIGQLMYYYELLTSLMGDLLNINAYDQPGVESGKQILLKKLQKN